ncbi:MAG: hypothetical protein CSA62_04035 [Planctomycetota bacterium]|nr:MAG: hypothetical protein CSA62_04035 [Planctomycetota bacterium]
MTQDYLTQKPRSHSRGIGTLFLSLAMILGICWIAGRNIWADGPRWLTTPVDEIQLKPGSLRVAVIGDIQNAFSEFADLQGKIAELKPDLLLQLGDTVNNAKPGRYAALHSSVRAHGPGVPILAVPGNHDLRRADDSLDLYREWIGPTEWRLDHEGWRILGLNNATGELSVASQQLLKESAAEPPKLGLIVLAHRPESAPLNPAPRVQFAGHVHSSKGFVDPAGTRHIHLGNNCDRSHDADPSDLPTVGLLSLDPDGKIEWDEQYTVPRKVHVKEELRRLVGGSIYPAMREYPPLFGALIAGFLAAGAWFWRKALS